jgi:hypothetical protein
MSNPLEELGAMSPDEERLYMMDDDELEKAEAKTESEDTQTLRPVRADGMDIPVKSLDEVYQMASMGANYKKKMADIAPYRRAVSAMKEHNLTDQDLALLIDIKKGDKAAITKAIQDSNVDPLDLDTENNNYEAKVYGMDEKQQTLQDIEGAIANDPEYKTTVNVVNNMWDAESQRRLSENPQMIQGLHNDIKNGIYEKVAPEAARLEFLDNGSKSKLEYYVEAGRLLAEQQEKSAEVEKQNKVQQEKKIAKKRKAAATTKSKPTKTKTGEPDWVNMSDDEYDKFYKEVMMS